MPAPGPRLLDLAAPSSRAQLGITSARVGVALVRLGPGARRVVARTPVDGSVVQIARGPASLVLLVAETNRIGPSRLVVVDADGASRSAKLDGILAGTTWPADATSEPIGKRLIPGLAV